MMISVLFLDLQKKIRLAFSRLVLLRYHSVLDQDYLYQEAI